MFEKCSLWLSDHSSPPPAYMQYWVRSSADEMIDALMMCRPSYSSFNSTARLSDFRAGEFVWCVLACLVANLKVYLYMYCREYISSISMHDHAKKFTLWEREMNLSAVLGLIDCSCFCKWTNLFSAYSYTWFACLKVYLKRSSGLIMHYHVSMWAIPLFIYCILAVFKMFYFTLCSFHLLPDGFASG